MVVGAEFWKVAGVMGSNDGRVPSESSGHVLAGTRPSLEVL